MSVEEKLEAAKKPVTIRVSPELGIQPPSSSKDTSNQASKDNVANRQAYILAQANNSDDTSVAPTPRGGPPRTPKDFSHRSGAPLQQNDSFKASVH